MPDEWDMALRVVVAGLLGGLVGYDREAANKPAGIRTHMVVAAGAALFVGTGQLAAFAMRGDGTDVTGLDASRVLAGVVTGIGFLGAGTIIRKEGSVRGLTTAAGVWTVAGIGATVALGFWWLAIIATGLLLAVEMASYFEYRIRSGREAAPASALAPAAPPPDAVE